METKSIDLVNIGLMLIACVAAYVLPFELFLFSYAVLGPLHYLTEISWLHERQYFTTGKFDYIVFVVLGVLLTVLVLFGTTPEEQRAANTILFMCFAAGLAMVVFDSWLLKIAVLVIAMVIGYGISTFDSFQIAVGVFLPTLIHVFLFTAIFMVYGALKSKSTTGVLSAIIFGLCAISFFFFRPAFTAFEPSDFIVKSMTGSKFIVPLIMLMKMLHMGAVTMETVFHSMAGKTAMRFMAFAYTYHYLNWFSKTSVIKWHKVPKKRLAAVVAIWVASVALYAYDYVTGLEWLFLLSMMHVFLEFPLNFRSFIGIGEELKKMISAPQPAPQLDVCPVSSKQKKKK
ncbi:MAG: hypothetical protein U0T73_04855 [Chitinophagales bacterium]